MFGDNSGFLQTYTQPQMYGQSAQQTAAPVKSTFNATFTQNNIPKTLTFAETPSGNVFLYEVKPLTILLVTPQSMVIPGYKVSNEQFMTPDGPRNGIVFYKNNAVHIKALDDMFGTNWKNNLSVPLPDPKEEKSPILLWNGTINNGTVTFYLYEYSDKCLVAFTPASLDSNQVKFCRNLACPHSPSGKCDGWLIYKSPGRQHDYLRSLIGNIDYESKYTKSKAAVAAMPIAGPIGGVTNSTIAATIDKEPMIIYENKIFNEASGIETQIEIYEYSPTSIVLFLTPHALISGLQEGNGLNHPKQGRRPGFTIAKKYAPSINLICEMFGITDLASRYTMEEVAQSTIDPRLNQQQAAMANSLSAPPSINDLPIETLAKSLLGKLSLSTTLEQRNIIGGNLIYFGPSDVVSETVDMLETYEILLDVKTSDKRLCILKNNDV